MMINCRLRVCAVRSVRGLSTLANQNVKKNPYFVSSLLPFAAYMFSRGTVFDNWLAVIDIMGTKQTRIIA